MNDITIHYIHNTDTYYIPHKELYIKRWMFLYADPKYLAHALGFDDMNTKDRDTLFTMLGREDDYRPDQYVIRFPDE